MLRPFVAIAELLSELGSIPGRVTATSSAVFRNELNGLHKQFCSTALVVGQGVSCCCFVHHPEIWAVSGC